MSSDPSSSGIMQKADQIAFHFYTKLFYTVNQARATEEHPSQGKIDKWVRSNLSHPDCQIVIIHWTV
jgi:autophagy-related protein 13